MGSIGDAVVTVLAWPVQGLAQVTDAGAWSAGWAIVLLVAGCALAGSPISVRSWRRRMLATRFRARRSAGRDMRSAATRREVHGEVRADLAAAGSATVQGGKVLVVVQVVVVVVVVVWSRLSGHASEASFLGLDGLDRAAVRLGPEAVAWVLLLGLAVLANGLVVHRGSGTVAPDQRVVDLAIQPVVLAVIGLLAPAGVLLGFATAMVCSLAVGAVALARVGTPSAERTLL